MRKVALLRTSASLYRLALAWPAVEREDIRTTTPEATTDPWAGVRFDFARLAALADTSPGETIKGFNRLKAHGIISPDGGLDDTVEKFFKKEGLAAFGIKPKAPKGE
jgi:hypothetical protein